MNGESQANDTWALRAGFISIIVKRDAVVRSFPGGPEAFDRVHQPAQQNGALFLVMRMSMEDVELVLSQLNGVGIIAGKDFAVADMFHGPLLECPGIIFQSQGELLDTRWTVQASTGQPTHTIRVEIIDSLLAAHGHWDEDDGENRPSATIVVDGLTLSKIKAGKLVRVIGLGWEGEEVGLVPDEWEFNERAPGSISIALCPYEDAEPEVYEAVAVWIDEEKQPTPPGYFEE